eukprot:COSAG01_NODE_1216_length_11192_cov_10.328678_10_plen_192_part_00
MVARVTGPIPSGTRKARRICVPGGVMACGRRAQAKVINRHSGTGTSTSNTSNTAAHVPRRRSRGRGQGRTSPDPVRVPIRLREQPGGEGEVAGPRGPRGAPDSCSDVVVAPAPAGPAGPGAHRPDVDAVTAQRQAGHHELGAGVRHRPAVIQRRACRRDDTAAVAGERPQHSDLRLSLDIRRCQTPPPLLL